MDAAAAATTADLASIEHWLNEASLQIHIPNLYKAHSKSRHEILTTSQREFAFYGTPSQRASMTSYHALIPHIDAQMNT